MLLYSIVMSFVTLSTTLGGVLIKTAKFLGLFLAAIPFSVSVLICIASVILIFQIPYIGSLLVLPYIYGTNILTFFGILKRDTTWCVVYDSKTKLPIDPAYVTVRDMQGKEVSSIITDLSGRFSLLLSRGLYVVEANKTNYMFPSDTMAGSKTDGKYNNLYFGSVIEIDDQERSVAISIPMDPIEEDWNQVEKKRKDLFYRFDDTDTYFRAAKAYSSIAAVITIVRSFYNPSELSLHQLESVIGVALLILLYAWRHRQYAHSFVMDKSTKLPVAFARVNVFSSKTRNKVSQKVTSFEGQFTCLLSQGTYYVTIEKRNEHGVYDLVFTSSPFSVNDGYMGKRFNV